MKKISFNYLLKPASLLLLSSCLLFNSACVMYNTGPSEVGVRTKKISFFGKRGVEQKFYPQGATYFFLPVVNDWHTFNTRLQNIEMTLTIGKGDVYGEDDLRFKTIDGNDISLDVIISYRIKPDKTPLILEYVAHNDKDLRSKIVRTIARSRPRDIFGELTTEDFYNSAQRAAKAEKAKNILNSILLKYGIVVESVLTKDYRFNTAYQKAIEDKKLADQKAEKNKSANKAKQEEYKRKLEEARGEVNKLVAAADGEFLQAKIKADAYYEQQKNIAQAVMQEGKADAEGMKRMKKALAAKGGTTMVKLKIAEALQNKKIFLIPSGSGSDMNLKTMDLNRFLQIQGLQKTKKMVEKNK
ncbi:MAG: prohibitin family protein [bacterium]|nr:prohibitin family protein [bacterium]